MNLHDWIDELSDVLDVDAEVDEGLLADLTEGRGPQRRAHGGAGDGVPPRFRGGEPRREPRAGGAPGRAAQALAEAWDRPATAPDPDDIDDEVPDDSSVDHTGELYEV